jgi:GntR family transcriptional regulator
MRSLVTDPVYKQLTEILLELLREGEFGVGDQFLTERELSERFGVSRATANKALGHLVADGTLEFRKGVGTFVSMAPQSFDLRNLTSFTKMVRSLGQVPATEVLELARRTAGQAGPEVERRLHLSDGDEVYYLERLRRADDIPVIYERRYVVTRLMPKLEEREQELRGSFYDLVAGGYGLDLCGADEVIRARVVDDAIADLLGVPTGSAALEVHGCGLIGANVPLWLEWTVFRGDAYEFHNRFGSYETGPAMGRFSDRFISTASEDCDPPTDDSTGPRVAAGMDD